MKVILGQDDWSPCGHFRASEWAQEIPDERAATLVKIGAAKKATADDLRRAKKNAPRRR